MFGESGGTCTHWLGNTLNTMGEILHYNLIGWLHIQNNVDINNSIIIINRVNKQKLFNAIYKLYDLIINPTISPSDIKCTPMNVCTWIAHGPELAPPVQCHC